MMLRIARQIKAGKKNKYEMSRLRASVIVMVARSGHFTDSRAVVAINRPVEVMKHGLYECKRYKSGQASKYGGHR